MRWLSAWFLASGLATAMAADNHIRVNSVGFLPEQVKQASVAKRGKTFSLLNVGTGQKVFTGPMTGPRKNADTGEVLFTADFSAVTNAGRYQLEVPGVGRSPAFQISAEVYRAPYAQVMRAFYLWRCGTAVHDVRDGKVFAHAACHTNDAWLDFATGDRPHKPSLGGWHDAGDYNKYVVNAGLTVGTLLRAWEDFGGKLENLPLRANEADGSLPEFLAEVKWELDWLLTIQDQDGSVFHKVSSQRFGGFVRPEADDAPRYFAPWSSEATANFVAALAGAARIYQAQDPQYAARCLRAAESSYAFLAAHPARHAADQSNFSTGLYAVPDEGARLWAAAEMWAATGRKECLQDLEKRLRADLEIFPEKWDYGTPQPLGGLTYLGSTRAGRDEALVGQLRSNLLFRADTIVEAGRTHGYARPGTVGYGWGYNGHLARQAVVLHAADRWSPKPAYRQAAADAVGFLLGRNVHGRSYVTGLGHQPPQNPHDRCSASDDLPGPWPGFLIGGPHPEPDDWHDEQKDYRTGEIAINWNSALVYALAWLGTPLPGGGQSAGN